MCRKISIFILICYSQNDVAFTSSLQTYFSLHFCALASILSHLFSFRHWFCCKIWFIHIFQMLIFNKQKSNRYFLCSEKVLRRVIQMKMIFFARKTVSFAWSKKDLRELGLRKKSIHIAEVKCSRRAAE